MNLERISSNGLDFRWKWGDQANYKFGSWLLAPLSRTTRGQMAGRNVLHPPGPRGLPLTGNIKDCLPDLWKNCFPLAEKHGLLIKLRDVDDVSYIWADPETVDVINQGRTSAPRGQSLASRPWRATASSSPTASGGSSPATRCRDR